MDTRTHQTETHTIAPKEQASAPRPLVAFESAETIIDIPPFEQSPSLAHSKSQSAELTLTSTESPSPSPSPTFSSASSIAAGVSSALSAYDTDSSTTSSGAWCTRHADHIYMERAANAVAAARAAPSSLVGDAVLSKAVDTRHSRWPIFIVLISLIEITIFVYDLLMMQSQQTLDVINAAPSPIATDSVFIYRPDRRLEVWRFVSYMFLHANWFHLAFNVVVQLFYGIPLEVMHGSTRVAVIYFAGVFAGSLGTSVVDSEVYLVGASGGVYALLAAHLANITLNHSQMKYAVAQLVSVVIFVSCDLGYAFYTQCVANANSETAGAGGARAPPTSSMSTPPVSYIAHLTGALAGLTIGLLVLKNFERRAYENLIWWLALGVYSAFTVFAIAFNLINTVTAQLMEEQGEVITHHLLHDLGVS